MSFDLHSCQPVVFKNNHAIVGWVFTAGWLWMLTLFTAHAAGTPGHATFVNVAFLALFWVAGFGIAAVALCRPCVRVEISHKGVLVREKAFLWNRTRQFAAKDLSVSGIVEDAGEGGSAYSCALKLPDDETIEFASSIWRSRVEQRRLQLMNALVSAERKARNRAAP